MNATLEACFTASFAQNANIRIASELELRKLEKHDGMPTAVLQIISATETSPHIRQAAAVYLKNRVARSWSEAYPPNDAQVLSPTSTQSSNNPISPADKETIKQNILQTLIAATQQILKVQLKTCLATVIGRDFPESWPDLLPNVLQCVQSGQEAQIEGGLVALVEILKSYRYRRSDRDIPNAICAQSMPLLANLGQSLLAAHPAPAAPEATGRLLHLITKAYKTSITGGLSPHQTSQESIVQWGTFLLQVVCRVIPSDVQPEDKDERESMEWWKAKKWAHNALNRLYSQYGSPSQLPALAAQHAAFAANFEQHFAPEIFKAYLRCIETYVNGTVWMSRRCCRFVLEFLEDCVKPKSMWQLLKPHLDTVIGRFVFPCICLTPEELEMFEDDPIEYSRSHFGDFIEDWFASPITAAISFVQVLARARKQQTLVPMLNIINGIVSEYPSKRSAVEKDAALRMLACLAPIVIKSKEIGAKMQDFFVTYVFPEFKSEIGFLRVRALDMVEKYEENDMTWPDSERLEEMFSMVMTCVTDSALPVRVQAALALPELVRYEEVRERLAANVGRLMQELLKLSEDTDIDALSKPIRALVTNFPDELLPFATGISAQMRDSYIRLLNEVVELRAKSNPDDLLNGGADPTLFNDDSDEKVLVAMNILQTLETLLRSVSTAPPIVAEIEIILLPILSQTVQHEFVELYDDLFELAHSLTYFQRSISQNMWGFFEQMYRLLKGHGIDYLEEMMNVFDNYVSYGADFLAQNAHYKHMLVDIYQTAMSSPMLGASDRVSACKLAGQVLLSLPNQLDGSIEQYITISMSFVLRENSEEEPVVTAELHANALEVIITAIYYNPQIALQVLEVHKYTQSFFSHWFRKLHHFTRVHDRKVCILAITGLLTHTSPQVNAVPGLAERLLRAAITLFEGLPKALEQRKQAEDEFGKDEEDDENLLSDDEGSEEAADDQDVQDQDYKYAELLAQKQKEVMSDAAGIHVNAKTASNGLSAGDDDDEEDDEYDEEEGIFGSEQLFETPLDKVDSYQVFVQALSLLQSQQQAAFTQMTAHLDQSQQQALHAIAQKAHDGGEGLKKAEPSSSST